MQAVLRFWVAVLSLVVSVAAVSYLFLSFLFPGTALVFEARGVRLAVLFVALVATGTLVWATVLVDTESSPSSPVQNRNR